MASKRDQQFIVRCPICGIPYQISLDVIMPTCGKPNCIREARSRGLPFATITKTPSVTKKSRKKKKGS